MLFRFSACLLLSFSFTAATVAQTATIVQGPYGPVVVPGQAQQYVQPQQQQFVQPQQQQFVQPQQQQFFQQPQQQRFPQQQQQFVQPQQQQYVQPQRQNGIFQQQQNRPFAQARPLAGQILNLIANEIPAQGNQKSKGILNAIGNGLSGNTMNQQQPQAQQQNGTYQRVPGGWAQGQSFAGTNPQTNGSNTQSTHYADSAFAAGREAGKANGKWQKTQILDANGNPLGYNNTQTWNNAITGQQHYQSHSYTPNSAGGVQKSTGFGLTGGR